jgi:DNA modification methylase
MKRTRTSAFGTSRRESHDASAFYNRSLYGEQPAPEVAAGAAAVPGAWADRVYCGSSEDMRAIPERAVALAFTSPPYNVGKDYDQDISLDDYLGLIGRVGREVYRVLRPGGRYVINVANLGRKPYIPLHAHFWEIHRALGFLPMGEIIWQKARGANGSCAWGSWRNARAPRIRDVHEYLLVMAREAYTRPESGASTLERDEFLQSTLSIWEIPPESARRVGHPAPFPLELAARVIRLYTFAGDVVLDPFMGSGTTCAAAAREGRRYVGYEVSPEYCALAERRILEARAASAAG